MTRRALISSSVLLALGACAARAVDYASERCVTWKDDVAAVLGDRCATCHTGATPAGGLDTSSYAAVIGDADKLAAMVDPARADAAHAGVTDTYALLSRWTGTCAVSYVNSSVHPGGILNPASADFHGEKIKALGWSMSACQTCHGDDFGGGAAGVACTTCHAGGPTACTTCHGQPPASGAHLAHAAGATLGHKLGCAECHKTPTVWSAPDHILRADGTPVPAPAEITFGTLASTGGGAPTFDHPSGTCTGVWCHGTEHPTWSGPPGQAACGACHGLPPSTHGPISDCSLCHQQVVDPQRNLIALGKHVDGIVEVGDGSGTCTACHGNAAHPLGGAHQSHLAGTHRLRAPLACSDCHVVPAQIHDAGHIDSPAPVVFPSGLGGLASADSATPTWTRAGATCSGTYCHGGGALLAGDTAAGLSRTPTWSPTGDQAYCGSCHGVPPVDGRHAANLKLTDCVTCHAQTVDAFGNIKVPGAHMNGSVDGN